MADACITAALPPQHLEPAKTLLELFPSCKDIELLDLFQLCRYDLELTINNLLDAGYGMGVDVVDVDTPSTSKASPPSSLSSSTTSDSSDSSASIETRGEEATQNYEKSKSKDSGYKGYEKARTHSNQNSRPLPLNKSQEKPSIVSVPSDDKNPKLSSVSRSCEVSHGSASKPWTWDPIESTCVSSNSNTATCGTEKDEDEGEIDDSTAVRLELPKDFLGSLVATYGDQPGLNLSNLTSKDRTIDLPHSTAFRLFQLLCVSSEKAEIQANEAAAFDTCSIGSISSGDECMLDFLLPDEWEEVEMYWEEDFPHLEYGKSSPIAGQQKQVKPASYSLGAMKQTMAQRLKFSHIKCSFPTLEENLIKDVVIQSNYDFDRALTSLKCIYPRQYVEKYGNSHGNQGVQPTNQKSPLNSGNGTDPPPYDPDAVARMAGAEKRELLELAGYWRQQAESFTDKYNAAKKDAQTNKQLKQAFAFHLQNATKHRHDANFCLGQHWSFLLLGLNAGNGNPNKIDLHGLGVKKATDAIRKFLNNRKAWAVSNLPQRSSLQLTVITGQGRHSFNQVSKLNPAIRQFLIDNHYSYTQGECVGHFVVRIDTKPAEKSKNTKKSQK